MESSSKYSFWCFQAFGTPAALPTRGLIFLFLSLPRPLLTPLSPLEAPPDPQTSPAPTEQALYRPDPYTGAFYAICVVD